MQTRRTILDPEILPVAGARWDWMITGLLAAIFGLASTAFGGLEPWSQLIVLTLAAILALCLVLRIVFDRDFRARRTWLYVPAVIVVLFVALQIAPLPIGALRRLAPTNVGFREQLLGETFASQTLATLSFYPRATAEQLRLLLVGLTVFVAVFNIFRTSRSIKTLLTIIFAIGCAEGVLALGQIFTRSSSYYWMIPSGKPIVTSGSFVNYSNFAQFMNLSLGAGLALLLIRIAEQRRDSFLDDRWSAVARRLWESQGWIFAGITMSALAVLGSMSRNGVIALLTAALIVGVALYRRGALGMNGWVLAVLPAAVIAVLLFVGFDLVYARLSSLHTSESYESRLDMNAATLRVWRQFPIWGTGLGTHEFVFPMFDTSRTSALAAHADNDYAQMLEEMGLIGASLVALFFAGVCFVAIQTIRHARSPLSMSVYGLLFGLIAVAIQSATDFGQRLPANFCLTATFCGLILSIARSERRRSGDSNTLGDDDECANRLWYRRAIGSGATIGVVAVFGTAIYHAYSAYVADRWSTAASYIDGRLHDAEIKRTEDDYKELLAAAEEAANADPGNVSYAYWLNFYRWETLRSSIEPTDGRVELRADEVPYVERIAEELASSRQLCPTFGPPYALEGQLRLFVLRDPKGADLIRRGLQLAPHDPPTCLVAGELAARSHRFDEATPLLMRAVELNPQYFSEVAGLCAIELKQPDLARELAGDDYSRLTTLVRLLATTGNKQLAMKLHADVEAALRRHTATADAKTEELVALAEIEQRRGNLPSAIELYRRALAIDYPQIEWRLSLARALADSGKLDDAIREVRLTLRLRPRQEEATRLLEQLSAQSEEAAAHQKQ